MDPADFKITDRPLVDHFADDDPDVASKHRERGHIELIDRVYAAIARGDSQGVLALLAPDATLTIEGFLQMDGHWEGAENILAAAGRNFSLVREQKVVIQKVCAQGDQLVILFHETGHVRQTGEPYEAHVAQWFQLANGRIASIREIAVTHPAPDGLI